MLKAQCCFPQHYKQLQRIKLFSIWVAIQRFGGYNMMYVLVRFEIECVPKGRTDRNSPGGLRHSRRNY